MSRQSQGSVNKSVCVVCVFTVLVCCLCVYSAGVLFVCYSAGVLVAYSANHNLSSHIRSTRRLVNTNMRDLKAFANTTPAVRLSGVT